MPEVVVGWCARRWARWDGIGGGKFYIWEGIIYHTPIWDVLAPAGERVEAGEDLQRVPEVWLSQLGRWCQMDTTWPQFCSWARCARFLTEKKVYCNICRIYTYYLPIFRCVGRREGLDGVE